MWITSDKTGLGFVYLTQLLAQLPDLEDGVIQIKQVLGFICP